MEEEKRAIAPSSLPNEKRVIASRSSLPNDVIDEIFSRLPVKTLIRLKSLSKRWRSTIESQPFKERHLMIAERSHKNHPKVIVISEEHPVNADGPRSETDIGFRTICLETDSLLSSTLVNFPQRFYHKIYVSESCDGLFCIHSPKSKSIYLVNPATRWFRQLPPAKFQILMRKLIPNISAWNPALETDINSAYYLGFVKTTDYKLVCLYDSDKYNSDASSPKGLTNCEVFDFKVNAWRYLNYNLSQRIVNNQGPVSANGSLYWCTKPYNGEIRLVALDIHTETFRLLPAVILYPYYIDMFILDNRLCISLRVPNAKKTEIWRLASSEDMWVEIYTIDWVSYYLSRYDNGFRWTPVAICKNKKILLSHCSTNNLVKYDPQTNSLSFFFQDPCIRCIPHFQSLISHI